MRNLCLSVLACAIAVLPTAAHPQNGLQLQMAAFSDLPRAEGADPKRVLAVGAGLAIGAVTGYSLLPFSAGPLIGAVAGGFIGEWWYRREVESDYAPLPRRRAQ
jgi:hypothetical protein